MLLAVSRARDRVLIVGPRKEDTDTATASSRKDTAGDGVGGAQRRTEPLKIVPSPDSLGGDVDRVVWRRARSVQAIQLEAGKGRTTGRGDRCITRRIVDAQGDVASWRCLQVAAEIAVQVVCAAVSGGREQRLALNRGTDKKLVQCLQHAHRLAGNGIGYWRIVQALKPFPKAPTDREAVGRIAVDSVAKAEGVPRASKLSTCRFGSHIFRWALDPWSMIGR